MRFEWLITAGTALAAAAACGGTVQNGDAVTSGGSGGPGAGGSGGLASMAGGSAGRGGLDGLEDGGLPDARYVDPGCAPAAKIQGKRECDPFAAVSTCPAGSGCLPYVQYADECQTEEVGTACTTVGAGRQGDDCTANDCAGGFVCATSGTGFQCAALCRFVGTGDTCGAGLLCTPLDVDGFFVCG
jgi:hypothetical protein